MLDTIGEVTVDSEATSYELVYMDTPVLADQLKLPFILCRRLMQSRGFTKNNNRYKQMTCEREPIKSILSARLYHFEEKKYIIEHFYLFYCYL